MEYNLSQVLRRRLKQIGKTWGLLADEMGVTRETLSAQTLVFEKLSLEKVRLLSEKVELNLMEDYLKFLRTTKDKKANFFASNESPEQEIIEDLSVWLCLKAQPEIYKENLMSTIQEIKQVGLKYGFKID